MKTVAEMYADLKADVERRQQLEQEQQQKKLECQQSVALAEKEMQEALARQDQEAYHAAEGKLSYAREVLRTFEAADVWWTPEEAQALISAAFDAYCKESREKYKEAFALLLQVDVLLADIHQLGRIGYTCKTTVTGKTKINRDYGFSLTRKTLPKDFANEVAQMAGTTYVPPVRIV